MHPTYGPVISDINLLPFPKGQNVALRWTGHLPSDELTAMLGIAKAKNWQQLLSSADKLSLPGQNFVFATKSGDIGQILATWVPKRPGTMPKDLIINPSESDRINQ